MSSQSTYALLGLLQAAGIRGSFAEIPNRYWPEGPHYDDVRTPWLRVYTNRGTIVIGWRKKVIAIDWSDSEIRRHGKYVVARPDVTHGATSCHAWGYDEAAGCLRRLWRDPDARKLEG